MKILTSKDFVFSNLKKENISENILSEISTNFLEKIVRDISYPRHYTEEFESNKKARNYIVEELKKNSWNVKLHDYCDNIIATLPPSENLSNSSRIIGATHYDSVPNCPGADDNGSGIAVLLAASKVLPKMNLKVNPTLIFFNQEEDGLLGSFEFVKNNKKQLRETVKSVHVMEMVGYTSNKQLTPKGFPVSIGNVGDFLGIVSNNKSNIELLNLLKKNAIYCPNLLSKGIYLSEGFERVFQDVIRSDHYPFWLEKIPALMWTDTSNFRNFNYHKSTDTSETLDYGFMHEVTKLFVSLFIE